METQPASPPDEIYVAIDQFNNREWFECHETLEELWMGERGMPRDFYQGILQIAVALHHWRNGNFVGAMKLLETGVEFLDRVDQIYMKADVAGLAADSRRLREKLDTLGKDRMAEADPEFIPKLRLTSLPD
jgi:uncharacterized protein